MSEEHLAFEGKGNVEGSRGAYKKRGTKKVRKIQAEGPSEVAVTASRARLKGVLGGLSVGRGRTT